MLVLLQEYELQECIALEQAEVEELNVKEEDSAAVREAKTKAAEKRAKQDRRCKSLLISRINDNMLEYIQDKESPKAIWQALERVFQRKSIASRLHLQKKLLTLRHGGGCLQDHFLTFERIVREYKSTGAKLEDIDVVCYLLLTLGPEFATVVTALETMPEDKLSLDFVKCRLLDEEIKRSGESGRSREPGEAAAFSGAGTKQQKKKKTSVKWKCFGCNREGHKIADCPEKNYSAKKNEPKKTSAHLGKSEKSVCFLGSENGRLPRTSWIIDSGSSEHLTNDRKLFAKLVPMKEPMHISVAKEGESIVAREYGEVNVFAVARGKSVPITLKNVLYIPDARVNLLSVRKMEMAGLKVVFADGVVSIERDSEVIAVGERRGKLYELDFHRERPTESVLYSCGCVPKELELWHRRYGHLSAKNLKVLIDNEMVDGMSASSKKSGGDFVCEPCLAGKQTRKPFACEDRQTTRVLELVHSDVCGPVTPVGIDDERYFVTFVDDFSRFTVVFLMNSKEEVLENFREYEALVSAKFGKRISRLRCDNGGEYVGREFRRFCKQKGIKIEYTVPYSPEQNGVSERMNRTLVEKVRSMLEDCGIGKEFWGPAIQTAAFLVNRSPASAIGQRKTPYEVWEGRRPNVRGLRAFGAAVHVHIPKERRRKLDAKSWKGIFVGYAPCGYRVWDPKQKKIVVVRDVVFVENDSKASSEEIPNTQCSSADFRIRVMREDSEEDSEAVRENVSADADDEEDNSEADSDESAEEDSYDSCADRTIREETEEQAEAESPARRSGRDRKPPGWHQEYEMNYTGFALNASSFVDNLPTSLAEMKKRPDWDKWQAAVREEMDSLERNQTWTLVKLPEGRVPITCKWLFKVKHNEGDEEDRYKARLVARGFSQKAGFDYAETYSPVARLDTVRVVLAVANEQRMAVHQMDVKTAFLNGHLEEEIYMTQPEGFERGKQLVCRLNRSLYGLKQASRAWNARFHSFVERLGFRRSSSDPCLYVKGRGCNQVILVLYVDDLLVVGRQLKAVEVVKRCLANEFEMTDIGEVQAFLGMRIDRDLERRILRISQRGFLENLLRRFNMHECKATSTPIECRLRLKKGEEAERTDKPYRELIGCLTYVTLTSRPDLCAAVSYLSQFQSCPSEVHWVHAKRVLRYIRGTLDLGLVFSAEESAPVIEAFADADWANDPVDRRSLTGFVFRVHGSTVSWLTRKQSTISLSSTEAELVALSTAVCHGIWLERLLKDLDVEPEHPVVYHEDNQSTIKVVEEERDTGRLKHVDVRHRFVREEIQRGNIAVQYIRTGEQVTDIMTKGLPVSAFQKHRASLGLARSGH